MLNEERYLMATFPACTQVDQWEDQGILYRVRRFGKAWCILSSHHRDYGMLLSWRIFACGYRNLTLFETIGRNLMSFIERSEKERERRQDAGAINDPHFADCYPALYEFVTTCSRNGKPRQTASITLFLDTGMIKCFVNDRETAQSFCVSSGTLLDAIELADRAIQDGTAQWRPVEQKFRKK